MHTRCSEARDALEALITRSGLHRIQDLPPFCGSNHDAFNRAPPGTALTPEGGQGGREDEAGAIPQAGGQLWAVGDRPPAQKAFRLLHLFLFALPFPPLALKSHPQPTTRNPQPHDAFARGSRIDALVHPPNIHNVEFPSIGESRHHPRSRPQPSITLVAFFSSRLSPLCARLLGSRLRLQSPPRWVFGKPCPPLRPPPSALPAAPCPSTSTFVRVCASRCRKRPSRIDSQHISRGLIVLCVGV